jgi:putative oxidoreductase
MLRVIGLWSRVAALNLAIEMFFASLIYHLGHSLASGEQALLYLCGYFVILLIGPGKWSADGMAR